MALEPCRVCGTLNSTESEICLSCEFPTKGRRRPAIFQWAAVGVVMILAIPLFMVLFHQVKPKSPPQLPTSSSAQRILNR